MKTAAICKHKHSCNDIGEHVSKKYKPSSELLSPLAQQKAASRAKKGLP